MKKFVLKVDFHDDRELQRKVLKTVSSLAGIDEIAIDLKGKKLTVIGSVDPVSVVSKLRKKDWKVEFITCGPKEEPKKEEPKKEEPKKEEPKKEESKKEEPKKEEPKKEESKKEEAKKEEGKKQEPKKEEGKKVEPEIMLQMAPQYRPYYPPMQHPYYPPMYRPYYPPINHSIEENPNACVIC